MKCDKESGDQNCVAILMSVRNEQVYLDFNISYHLDKGFDLIFIANHGSTDRTNQILEQYDSDPRVVILQEDAADFDHAVIVNKILAFAKENYHIDWFLFLDADEFFTAEVGDVHNLTSSLQERGICYATVGWVNALFDFSFRDFTCAPTHALDTTKFYRPWPEKPWQDFGHFRKALVQNHDNIEIVVGGHFVKSENNPEFLGEFYWNPFIVPETQARILHFELRDRPSALLEKWKNFAAHKTDSTSSSDAPWHERIDTIRSYAEQFSGNVGGVRDRWFVEHRTFWGTEVPSDRLFFDPSLVLWYRKYFRRKVESGTVRSVCLVRDGHLGDLIMTEPTARFLKDRVDKVYLATSRLDTAQLIDTYDGMFPYESFEDYRETCDLNIRLAYEYSDNQTTYINGFLESIGYGDTELEDLPKTKMEWPRLLEEKYFLVSPFTSTWEEEKRSWGSVKYNELAQDLSQKYALRAVILDHSHSFEEMISLISHCEFFIGDDSGPAVIAQSLGSLNFVLFGATSPKYHHLNERSVPIFQPHRHSLCSHSTRNEEIECCEEFCMEELRYEHVFDIIDGCLQSQYAL